MKRASRVVCAVVSSLVVSMGGLALAEENAAKSGQQPAALTQQQPAPQSEESQQMIALSEAKKIVVAKVNDAPITMDLVVRMMNRIGSKGGHGGHGGNKGENTDEIKTKALDRLILHELAYQRAGVTGLKTDKKNIDTAISNLKENLGGEEAYKKFLAAEGTTEEEIRAQVERSLTIELIFAREVLDRVTIPEDELRAEYEKQKEKYIRQEKIVVTDVVFFLKNNDKDSLAKAEGVLRKIKEDKESDPWKLVLDGSFIVRTFEINRNKHKELYEEARKLKEGDLSGVIQTPDSLHIVKLKEYVPEKQFTLEEAKGSLEGKLRYQAQQKRIQEWEGELKKNAKIEIIEAKHTPQAAR